MEVLQVKDYNKKAMARYKKRVDEWEPTKGGFPNLCFYMFSTPKGMFRRNGYVISKANSHYFRLTKKEVKEEFNIAV